MWENVPDFLELFRNFPVSISVLFVIPVVLLSGPSSHVMAAHEFPVFRMQQFDLHQTQSGKATHEIRHLCLSDVMSGQRMA